MSGTHAQSGSMQDGRFFTAYMPNCMINSLLASKLDTPTWNSSKFRADMQANGMAILREAQGGPCGDPCADNGMSMAGVPEPPMPSMADDGSASADEPAAYEGAVTHPAK